VIDPCQVTGFVWFDQAHGRVFSGEFYSAGRQTRSATQTGKEGRGVLISNPRLAAEKPQSTQQI